MGWRGWTSTDLRTFYTGAPPAFFNPAGHAGGVVQRVIYQGFTQGQGGNGTLHLFEWSPSWGGWHYGGELTGATGAPLAHQFTDLTSYYFAAENSDHFDYMAVGGHVCEILFDSNGWGFHDLSKDARARVTALNGPSGYEFHNLQQVFYRGTDSHVQELSWDVTGWHPRDLTSITGTPTVRGSGPLAMASRPN